MSFVILKSLFDILRFPPKPLDVHPSVEKTHRLGVSKWFRPFTPGSTWGY